MARPFFPPEHYANRLGRVLAHIDAHLTSELQLPELAAQASFSPFHFHRIFCEWHSETPQAYIRRRRLERGAALLRYAPDICVKDIAPQCGFDSAEAFNRAFRTYFGMTPGRWRQGGYDTWQVRSNPQPGSAELNSSQVRLISMQPMQALYMRKIGPYTEGEAGLWARLDELAASLGVQGDMYFGVGLDDPAVTPEAHCRFDACVALPRSAAVPVHVPVKPIFGGQYAVLPYSGPFGKTESHWRWLLQDWLPGSGFRISQVACFERYPGGIPDHCSAVKSELCLPLSR